MAFTPLTGNTPADMYMDLLARVSSKRRISVLLLSNSLVEATGVLQPTPLCHIAYETLFLPAATFGRVKSEKKSRSISVSMISSASGLAF